ncbi:carbohydrate esterase family 1 protein [Xylariomycetidae sp. FL2044]|nr:carbohydrate esterase family 1 protein [Xylariomycetidae sp. FL2044]
MKDHSGKTKKKKKKKKKQESTMRASTSLILLAIDVAAAAASSRRLRRRQTNACDSKTPAFTPGSYKTYHTAEDRKYRVWLPAKYDNSDATPLILSYHGANGDIDEQIALDDLTDPLFNSNHIVAYLQGTADDPDEPDHTTWEGAPGSKSNDIKFTQDVLDNLESKLCIDPDRIYATGKSQGGGFVGRLACDADTSKRIAAFAPVSGAYYIGQIDKEAECARPDLVTVPCDAGRADIPILAFHGGNDTTIAYHGDFRSGSCLPDVRSWARQWAERDGVEDTPVNSTLKGADNGVIMSYGGGLVRLVYDGDDIGHDWPSTIKNGDNSKSGHGVASFNASSMIMEFFRGVKLE